MIIDKELKLVYCNNDEQLYKYHPRLFRLHYQFLDRYFFGRKLRYLYEYFQKGKYLVYYFAINNELIGQCVVMPGGSRAEGTTKKDILIGGPYYVIPGYRNKGICKKMISLVLKYCSYDYENVFDYVSKGNTASLATSQSIGMKIVGEGNLSFLFHKLKLSNIHSDLNKYLLLCMKKPN